MWRRLFTDQQNWRLAGEVLIPTALVAWIASRAASRVALRGIQHVLRDSLAPSSPLVIPFPQRGVSTYRCET